MNFNLRFLSLFELDAEDGTVLKAPFPSLGMLGVVRLARGSEEEGRRRSGGPGTE